jgi:hypothetical protein
MSCLLDRQNSEKDVFHILFTKIQDWKNVEEVCCPICLENINDDNMFITNCNHKFHKLCISKLEEYSFSTTCPMCREIISERFDFCSKLYELSEFDNIRVVTYYNPVPVTLPVWNLIDLDSIFGEDAIIS